ITLRRVALRSLCVAEASATNKLNKTLGQITSALANALTVHDQARASIRALLPLAPLFSC
ncbi:MAG: hypothetical protein LC775_18340, partial [Acidobacteria bacterium]|nr:hypothetical protein [Acidobacteriota bacterium]